MSNMQLKIQNLSWNLKTKNPNIYVNIYIYEHVYAHSCMIGIFITG